MERLEGGISLEARNAAAGLIKASGGPPGSRKAALDAIKDLISNALPDEKAVCRGYPEAEYTAFCLKEIVFLAELSLRLFPSGENDEKAYPVLCEIAESGLKALAVLNMGISYTPGGKSKGRTLKYRIGKAEKRALDENCLTALRAFAKAPAEAEKSDSCRRFSLWLLSLALIFTSLIALNAVFILPALISFLSGGVSLVIFSVRRIFKALRRLKK